MRDKLKKGLENFKQAINKPEIKILPGHLAFSFVLSIIPTLTILAFVASFFNVSLDFIRDFIAKAFSEDFANILFGVNMTVHADLSFVITLIIGYLLASSGTSSIIVSSNAIYGIENTSFLKRRLKALVMILIIILLFVFMLIFGVFGNKLMELFEIMNINQNILVNIKLVFSVLKGPISWFIIFFFIKVIYTMAPDKKIDSKLVNKGAIFTTVGYILVTYIYSLYSTHIARYDVFYGNLASIAILMVWLYLLSIITTLGLALNYRQEEKLEKSNKTQ